MNEYRMLPVAKMRERRPLVHVTALRKTVIVISHGRKTPFPIS